MCSESKQLKMAFWIICNAKFSIISANMKEDRISGMWWLPDRPKDKIAGYLLIKDRKLELNGSFNG